MKNIPRKSKEVIIVLAFFSLLILSFLYVMPCKWLDVSDKDKIAYIEIKDLIKNKSAEISDREEITELLSEINKTPTKKRIFLPDDFEYGEPDSCYVITAHLSDDEQVYVIYSRVRSGLSKDSPKLISRSFSNKKLTQMLDDYIEKA